MNYFGNNMAYLRNKNGLGQKEIAVHIGCTQAAIANYEAGKREPELEVALRISKLLNQNLEEMISQNLSPVPYLLPKNLKYLRKKEKYTQDEMARLLMVTPKCISFYENGGRKPTIEGLLNLAEFFGVSVDDLLKRDLEKEGF